MHATVSQARVEDPVELHLEALAPGVVEMDLGGRLLNRNRAAEALLDGAAPGELDRALAELRVRAETAPGPVEGALSLGGRGDLHALVARADCLGGYVALLSKPSTAHSAIGTHLARALGGLTKAEPARAVQCALTSVRSALGRGFLVAYEIDERSGALECVAHVGTPATHGDVLERHLLSAPTSLVALAVSSRRPQQASNVARSALPFERRLQGGERLSAVALPAEAGGQMLGAVYMCGPRTPLADGELALLHGLADVVASLLRRSKVHASADDSGAGDVPGSRERLEAEVTRLRGVALERDRLAVIGQLAAGVAHEINNPLAFVKANLTLIDDLLADLAPHLDASPPSATARELMKELVTMARESAAGVSRIEAIVANLKGMARTRPGEKASFEPAQAVRQAVQFFAGARQCGARLTIDLPPLPEVVGEAGALCQVVLNLLDNAWDAVGGKGHVSVTGRHVGERVQLRVSDDGPGIPAEAQPRIFEMLFTTKGAGKGTGLGLYISQQIVTGCGGSLRFETSPAGTTFVVDLPMAQGEVA